MEDSSCSAHFRKLTTQFFFSLLIWELETFHLKETLYSFSLAYPNCQHHPLVFRAIIKENKDDLNISTAITWQASNNPDSHWVTNGQKILGMIYVPSVTKQDSERFHHVTQNDCNLKLMKCFFLEFSMPYFSGHSWVTETRKSETMDKEGLLFSQCCIGS